MVEGHDGVGGGLLNVEHAVGLQRESPLWVVEHGLHAGLNVAPALLGIVDIARLQKVVLSLNVVVLREVLPSIHNFELVAMGEQAGVAVASVKGLLGR